MLAPEATRVLVEAVGNAKHKPSVLVCASATGIYGAHPADEELDERQFLDWVKQASKLPGETL